RHGTSVALSCASEGQHHLPHVRRLQYGNTVTPKWLTCQVHFDGVTRTPARRRAVPCRSGRRCDHERERVTMTDRLVLIVGAGPTGLVLALWLTRLGVRVRIVESADEPETTSRAVAVQARTLELYRQVDLSAAVVEAGVQVAAANLWVGGARAARLPLG